PEPVDVAELWANLEGSTAAERRMLVEDLEEYWNGELCLRVAAESLRKAPDDPEALELAELAVLIADHLPEQDPERPRLQAQARPLREEAGKGAGTSETPGTPGTPETKESQIGPWSP